MSLEAICQRMPPLRLRLLARTGHGKACRPLSYSEIAEASGLARSTVIKLLSRPTWGNTGILTIDALFRACGRSLSKTETDRKLIKRGKLVHLDNANASQRRMFGRMLRASDSSTPGHHTGPGAASNAA